MFVGYPSDVPAGAGGSILSNIYAKEKTSV